MSISQVAASVVALDIHAGRLETDLQFGATYGLPADGDLPALMQTHYGHAKPIDVIIEVSGEATAMENTLELMAIGGTAVWLGATFPQRKIGVDAEKIVRNLYQIKGLHNYNGDDFITAVRFVEQHYQDFPFEEMIHDGYCLDQVNEAFEYAVSANPFRVGVRIE